MRTAPRTAVLLAAALLAAAPVPAQAAPHDGSGNRAGDKASGDAHVEGKLPSGAAYVLDRPADWNGTVLLFSHGYRPAGSPNTAENAPSSQARKRLLEEGYALAGSSYASTGWAVTDAVPDQLATLGLFTKRFGQAGRTLAWGESYGGLVTTALAERHPDRVDGTLSLCGLVHGGVANWNNTLDPVFALKTLLAPDTSVPLTGFGSQEAARKSASVMSAKTAAAQKTPEGRARIALAAALHNIPGYNDPAQKKPGPADWDTQQANQYTAVAGLLQTGAFSWRQEAESRAGGNPSWNTGVDYTAMLRRSPLREEVGAVYAKAGLSLDKDLAALRKAPRISADPGAAAWMSHTSSFTGELRKPQLNIHTTGDALVPVQTESAYRRAATAAGSDPLLRQAYVNAPGHCTFTTGEAVAAVHTLELRVDTGHWSTSPATLNSRAAKADPSAAGRYSRYRPAPYPRPYDRTHPTD